MALDNSRLGGWKNYSGKTNQAEFFAFHKVTLQNLANKYGCVSEPTFYTFYTSHLRWNSTMKRYFYHTDLRQNAFFHTFSSQIALIQYSGPSKHAWAFSKAVQKIFKITITASRFSLLTSAKFALNINRVTLQHHKEFIVFIFLFNGFITMWNLKKRLIRAAFWVLLQAMFMNDWKETAKRLKLQERQTNNQ